MRILFISSKVPVSLETNVTALHKRMRLFVDAIKEFYQLDVLLYLSPESSISSSAIANLEHRLCETWNTEIKLFVCAQFTNQKLVSKWQREGLGIVNYLKLPDFLPTSGSSQVQIFEQCLERKPDAIFIHRLCSFSPALITNKPLPPIFFDLDDIEHTRTLRDIRQPPKSLLTPLHYLKIPALLWGECQAVRLAHQTFVCSEVDRRYLTERLGLPGVVVIPNAVTIPEPQPLTSEPTLLLLASYDYSPNINAANFLVEKVWPIIHQTMPKARLYIAGPYPENLRHYQSQVPGVTFTGFIDDLNELYQQTRVVCCPIFSGGGTRVKIIEAAAYGKPIVATRIGVEGLQMTNGKDFLQEDNAAEFADACLRLLSDDDLCNLLGASARDIAIRNYERNNVVQLIQEQLLTMINSSTSVG
jgi:glycosyltransferase involved in cell wall biosynthesis